ncbi:hypothetical protein TBLA_0B07390 [Henningerozyma blattae CBS 6284]|uniref:BRCT domain-containing protein n=1 Tax=Henningerozyma blattae (strain ATCC 34711 / CBS 6284 / DSM 70876 / NBRC 10599 / NRRL Y-10934 / UCD 77-7) TaxID=1071380 RepID=I2GZK5_HENB6|nr:hypothetical protein TBLA_0B07390 [Tetrapisispora blattae CBS 6284]CCH59557.1 hypothetical protein TBLA_0B07390 [Tetrapisispora blattae CBS 6284]
MLFKELNVALINDHSIEFDNIKNCLIQNGVNHLAELDIYELKDIISKYKDSKDCDKIYDWLNSKFDNTIPDFIILNKQSFDQDIFNILTINLLLPIVDFDFLNHSIRDNKVLKLYNYTFANHYIFARQQHLKSKSATPDISSPNLHFYVSNSCFTSIEYLFIKHLIISLGGSLTDILSNSITHLISNKSDDPAIIAIKNHPSKETKFNNINFVFPTWLYHCWKVGSIQNVDNYVIPDNSTDCSTLYEDSWDFINKKISFSNTHISPNLLTNKTFIVSMNLKLSKNLLILINDFIISQNGKIKRYLDENDFSSFKIANCYIGANLISNEYNSLLSNKKLSLGNLIWLLNIWQSQKFIDPSTSIWYTPFQSKLLNGQTTISFTNFYGVQRYYLQLLIYLLGANSSVNLTKKFTNFLIVKKPIGKKFESAKLWNSKGQDIKILNHRWLHDCYIQNKNLKLIPKYLIFPKDNEESIFDSFGYINNHTDMKIDDVFSLSTTQDGGIDSTSTLEGIFQIPQQNINELPSIKNVSNTNPHHSIKYPSQSSIDPFKTPVSLLAPSRPSTVNYSNLTEKLNEACVLSETEINDVNDKETNSSLEETLPPRDSEFQLNNGIPHADDVTILDDDLSIPKKTIYTTKKKKPNLTDKTHKEESVELVAKAPKDLPNNSKKNQIEYISEISSNEIIKSVKCSSPFKNEINDDNDSNNSTTLFSSPSHGSRAAKSKANKRMHTDIESLNQYQKSNKRKKTVEEFEDLENNKKLDKLAKEKLSNILNQKGSKDSNIDIDLLFSKKSPKSCLPYNIEAVCTGCPELNNELELHILKRLGIKIHDDITSDNIDKLNTIFAPKKMRTAKFLKSFSFKPLKYLLTPSFLIDLLAIINGKKSGSIKLPFEKYQIRDFEDDINEQRILNKTNLPTKIFERGNVTNVNLINDIPGGIEVIRSILTSHGMRDIKIIPKTFNKEDFIQNIPSKKDQKDDQSFDCIFIVSKGSQVKKFKKVMNNDMKILAVKWDWCVNSIFNLDVTWDSKDGIVYQS